MRDSHIRVIVVPFAVALIWLAQCSIDRAPG
jgi:hypothetical protein